MPPEGPAAGQGNPALPAGTPRPSCVINATGSAGSGATLPALVRSRWDRPGPLSRDGARPWGPYGPAARLLVGAVLVSLALSGPGALPLGSHFSLPSGHLSGDPHVRVAPAVDTSSLLLHQASVSLQDGQGPSPFRGSVCANSQDGRAVSCRAPLQSPVPTLGWSPIGSPLGRSAVTMAYDAADGYVVLFSDGSSSSVQGDTWVFQGGEWRELTPSVAPSPRLGAYMTYDSRDGYVVLFGGWGGNSGPYEYGDTWAFAGGSWHLLIPESSCAGEGGSLPCPSARDSGSIADDPSDALVILFGGYGGLGDTWGFGGGNWVLLIPQSTCAGSGGSAPCPSPRDGGAMAWDPSASGDVLFGGAGPLNDTWLFRAGSWQQVVAPLGCTGSSPCPSARTEASLAFDYADNTLLLFGGYTGSLDLSDTWSFHAGSWSPIPPASGCRSCPAGRSGAGLAYDPALGAVFLFGGYAYRGDAWSFSAGAWSPVLMAQAPGPRWDASLAWDPLDQAVLLFGGYDGSVLGDTWAYAHGDWSPALPPSLCTASSCPSARLGASLAWDATDQEMVLFGGMTTPSGGFMHDTWTFARGNWSQAISGSSCTSTTCPSARANASMAWDPTDREVVLFGGYGGSYVGDTWAFSSGSWSQVLSASQCSSQPCPSARESSSLASAPPPSNGVILFGGAGPTSTTNDTWHFSSGAWTELLSPTVCRSQPCPALRSGAGMALDPTAGTLELFGGANGTRTLSDTWVFDGSNWTRLSLYGPSGRSFASLAPDPSDGYLLLVGGRTSYGPATDVWALGPSVTASPPTATPSTLDVGETTTFDELVSGSGTAATWTTWQGLPPGCAAPVNGAGSLSCAISAPGTFYVSSVVTFTNGLPGATSSFLAVTVDPDPAVIVSAHPAKVALGSNLTLWANVSGGTSPFASYTWSGLPGTCAAPSGASHNVTCVPSNDSDLGSWQVSVSVVDSSGFNLTSSPLVVQVVPDTWSVSVRLGPSVIDLGQYEIVSALLTGLSGSANFQWSGLPSGCTGSIGSLQCVPTNEGSFSITVTATAADPAEGSATSPPATLSVLPALAAPTLVSSSPTIALGSSVVLTASESGGDPPYAYIWRGLPPACSPADTAVLTCVPDQPGVYTPSVQVSDALGNNNPTTSTTVDVNATSSGVLLSASRTSLDIGQTTLLSATVVGGGKNATFEWIGLPPGCLGSGPSLSCAPSAPGIDYVAVQVDLPPGSPLLSNVLTLTVGTPLSDAGISVSSGDLPAGTSLDLSGHASGGSEPYHFLWGGLPTGCLAADSASLSCVPTVAASYTVSLEVTDAEGATSNATASVVVTPAISPAPASTSASGGPSSSDGIALALSGLAIVLVVLLLLTVLPSRRRKGGSPPDRSRSEPGPSPAATATSSVPKEPAARPPPSTDATSPSWRGAGEALQLAPSGLRSTPAGLAPVTTSVPLGSARRSGPEPPFALGQMRGPDGRSYRGVPVGQRSAPSYVTPGEGSLTPSSAA